MSAAHDDRTAQGWARIGDWFLRAYDVLVDEDEMQKLRRLDRTHSLALAFSHRSYLDGMVIPKVLSSRRFSPTYTFGGANLNSSADRLGRQPDRPHLHPPRDPGDPGLPARAARPTSPAGAPTSATWPGRSRAAAPAPASCARRSTASCKYLADAVAGRRRASRTRMRGAGLDRLRPAARGLADDRGGARRQQDAGGLALAGALRAAAAQPARPRLPRLRRAVLAARADGRAAPPRAHRRTRRSSGSPSTSPTGSTAPPRSPPPRSSRSRSSAPTGR